MAIRFGQIPPTFGYNIQHCCPTHNVIDLYCSVPGRGQYSAGTIVPGILEKTPPASRYKHTVMGTPYPTGSDSVLSLLWPLDRRVLR